MQFERRFSTGGRNVYSNTGERILSIKAGLAGVINELQNFSNAISDEQLARFTDEIAAASRIFTIGAGRSGLMLKAFAMRLMHLGKQVSIVGDETTPSAGAGDLLLICSGSGETGSLVSIAQKASALGAKIALNTMDETSALARLSDVVVVLPGTSPKVLNIEMKTASMQPMGSSFEQLSLLVYDAVIMALMEKLGQTENSMFARHANLE